jgi:hypothetical protein
MKARRFWRDHDASPHGTMMKMTLSARAESLAKFARRAEMDLAVVEGEVADASGVTRPAQRERPVNRRPQCVTFETRGPRIDMGALMPVPSDEMTIAMRI